MQSANNHKMQTGYSVSNGLFFHTGKYTTMHLHVSLETFHIQMPWPMIMLTLEPLMCALSEETKGKHTL